MNKLKDRLTTLYENLWVTGGRPVSVWLTSVAVQRFLGAVAWVTVQESVLRLPSRTGKLFHYFTHNSASPMTKETTETKQSVTRIVSSLDSAACLTVYLEIEDFKRVSLRNQASNLLNNQMK